MSLNFLYIVGQTMPVLYKTNRILQFRLSLWMRSIDKLRQFEVYVRRFRFIIFYNMENDSDMELKQTYLRQEILERQYDPQKFIQFLDERLSIGDDLTLCTFEQLKIVVQDFIKFKQSSSEEESPYPDILDDATKTEKEEKSFMKEPSSQMSSKPRPVLFVQIDRFNFTENQFSKTFKCIKINDRLSKTGQLRVEVCNPQRKTIGGFFGIGATSFLEFEVKTQETGWVVGRRYSDFVWLRNFLRKMYPAQIVPPIPQKKAAKRTQRHVDKRMRILTYFLNDVVNIPEFLNNRIIEGFLKIKDNSKLSQLKEEGDKMKYGGSVNSVETETGEITVDFSLENKAYMEEMRKVIPQVQRLYKFITRQGKALQIIQTDEVNTLYEMGNLFAECHQKSRDVLNRVPKATGLKKLNEVYVALNNMVIEWGTLIRNQWQIIQKNFNSFFKYVRNDLLGYLQVFNLQTQAEQDFCKAKIALDKKKEKIYAQFDASKWDLPKETMASLPKEILHDKTQAFKVMLPRDNKELQTLRVNNALIVSQLFVNGDNNLVRSANKFQENFKEWSINLKVNTQQIGQLWNEVSHSFSGEGGAKGLKEKPMDMNKGDDILDD